MSVKLKSEITELQFSGSANAVLDHIGGAFGGGDLQANDVLVVHEQTGVPHAQLTVDDRSGAAEELGEAGFIGPAIGQACTPRSPRDRRCP